MKSNPSEAHEFTPGLCEFHVAYGQAFSVMCSDLNIIVI